MQVINTNIASLNAQHALTKTQEAQQVAMERLSSGVRINRAKDDAAGLSVSEHMTTQIRSLNQAVRNSNDGISYVQSTEGALNEVSSMLQRIRELTVQATGGTVLNSAQHDYIDQEVLALGLEISNVIHNTKFNGIAVFTGSTKLVQTGWESGDTMTIGISNTLSAALASYTAFADTANVHNTSELTLGRVDTAITAINDARSRLGAQQNRLEHNVSNLMNVSENLSASRSRILDADFAAESSELARNNVLQQAGLAMLSQANVSSQQILTLLGK
jgi:flagellin